MSLTSITIIAVLLSFVFYTFDVMNKMVIDIKLIKNKISKL